MGKKTINQALKDLFLGLGGNPSALSDNTSVSDYIADLESAIKGTASGVEIDDSAPSESKVYSSAKVESLIPEDELPEVIAEDIGDVLTVVSDGEEGATWGKGEIPKELPNVAAADIGEALIVESDGEGGAQWGKGAIPQNAVVLSATIFGSNLVMSNSIKGSNIHSLFSDGKFIVIYTSGSEANVFYCYGKQGGSLIFVSSSIVNNGGVVENRMNHIVVGNDANIGTFTINNFVIKSAT